MARPISRSFGTYGPNRRGLYMVQKTHPTLNPHKIHLAHMKPIFRLHFTLMVPIWAEHGYYGVCGADVVKPTLNPHRNPFGPFGPQMGCTVQNIYGSHMHGQPIWGPYFRPVTRIFSGGFECPSERTFARERSDRAGRGSGRGVSPLADQGKFCTWRSKKQFSDAYIGQT